MYAAHRGDDRCLGQPPPVDALEGEGIIRIPGEGIIRIPEDLDLVAYPRHAQQPIQMEHSIDCVPFLSQDDGAISLLKMRQEHLLTKKWREGGGIVNTLAFFTLVYTARMILADPLTPAMELQPAISLMARQLRIAKKPQMSLIVGFSEGMDQTVYATGKAPGAGIGVVAFKRKDMKLHGGSLSPLRSCALI